MSTVAAPEKRFYSVEEYLAREAQSLEKHEYYRGEIFAMAGATIRHNIIASNVSGNLFVQLRGKECRPFGSDLRIKVESEGLITYADIAVICGPVQTAKDDRHSATNPRVIVEVISDSSENHDRGWKTRFYLKLESLREYIVIAQNEPRVDKIARRDDGTWSFAIIDRLEDVVEIASIGCRLSLAEIYSDIAFDALPDAPPAAMR